LVTTVTVYVRFGFRRSVGALRCGAGSGRGSFTERQPPADAVVEVAGVPPPELAVPLEVLLEPPHPAIASAASDTVIDAAVRIGPR
jgi:hypothetical protein